MVANTSSPASAFTKVLRSFETGGFTYRDVVAELKRLLKAGASPNEIPASHPPTVRIPTIVPNAARVEGVPKTTIRIAPAPRIPDLIPIPESKVVTIPVQIPVARVARIWTPAQSSSSEVIAPKRTAADGHDNVIARAITLARTSASPARAAASPDSVQRKTRIVPTAKLVPGRSSVAAPTPSPTAAPTATPGIGRIPTLFPLAEEPVKEGQPAQVESHERDDWSDLAILREDLTPDAAAVGSALRRRAVAMRGSMVRAIGLSAAAIILAAIAWFYARQALMSTKAAAPAAAAPIPGTLIRDCPTCAAMIVLPAARFQQGLAATDRGSPSYEKPQHWVNIVRPFAMSADLVTVEDYRQFIDATGRAMQGCDTYDGSWSHRPGNNWQNPGFAQTGLHPVTCVSWNDAVAYVQWLSAKTGHQYRLPSASEWEYAARAGGETVYPWTSNGSNACAFANVADASAARRYPGWVAFACDDGYANTSPVGSFKANPLGLNDMLGNLFQWTLDCWHADYSGAPVDGSARADGDCSERELRGGSWFTSPSYVRANYRNHFAADYRTSSAGIRLVRDIGP